MKNRWLFRSGTSYIFILGVCSLIAMVVIADRSGRLKYEPDLEQLRSLTKPLRLEVVEKGGFSEFLVGLRTFHYRAKLRGEADYIDVFYDTEDWRLFRLGFSYRFRQRRDGGDTGKYSVRLEQEPRFVSVGSTKIDVTSEVPGSLGYTIAGGAWENAFMKNMGLPASDRLHAILRELRIGPEHLTPKLKAQLHRERFDITDKGRNWFELDHELWTFSVFPNPGNSASVVYEDIAIDTRLKIDAPELTRRVRTMRKFAAMIYGVQYANRSPHERAIQTLP